MIKNIVTYLVILISAFIFNIFYYGWFSWFLLVLTAVIPLLSLIFSLPFMIYNLSNGFELYADSQLFVGDKCSIFLKGKRRQRFFVPLLKLKLRLSNGFSGENYKFKILASGLYSQQIKNQYYTVARHCGCVKISAGYCRVYDFLGIFFVPVKIKSELSCTVITKSSEIEIPDYFLNSLVVGYKPKSCSSSDLYEIREYQNGDSLRNIHWKLSSKTDELVVREPVEPIVEIPRINLVFGSLPACNDLVISRFIYVFSRLCLIGSPCIVTATNRQTASLISDSTQLKDFLVALYSNKPYNTVNVGESNGAILAIGYDKEGEK